MRLMPLAMWTPGLAELVIILIIILLVFGYKRLPELMRNLGIGFKEFKKGIKEGQEEKKGGEASENDKKGTSSSS